MHPYALLFFLLLHTLYVSYPKVLACSSWKLSATDIALEIPRASPALSLGITSRLCKYLGDGFGHSCICNDKSEEGNGQSIISILRPFSSFVSISHLASWHCR